MSTGEPTDADLKRLGDAVLRRRTGELRVNQSEVERAGGPSTTTQTKIEAGRRPVPSRATLRKLDAGLHWAPDSAWRMLYEGVEPTPLTGRRPVVAPLRPAPELPRIEGGPLRRLIEIRRELDKVIDELRAE